MQRKIILSAKVIVIIIITVKCEIDNDIVNEDLLETKFRISDRSVLTKLSEHIKNNQNYADIQIMDDNGQLKTLKLKAAKPKVPLKTSAISDKVSNQVETLTVVNKNGATKNKSKFFDEIEGCKY